MAVAIRLSRGGSKKRPYYRIVVADSRNGTALEFRAELDVGGELPFVVNQLFGADHAVAVCVEQGKETIGVRPHLFRSEPSVAIAVRLVEPPGERIVCPAARAKGLAHRAYERGP